MDSVLLVGNKDEKLPKFLRKLGYIPIIETEQESISKIIDSQVVDVIVLDARMGLDSVEMCEFFRNQEITKPVPIVFLSDESFKSKKLKNANYDRIEIVDIPYSIGRLASLLATQLRLRKMTGMNDNISSSIIDKNLALRDMTKRMKKDLDDARAIQDSLLPKGTPDSDEFEIATAYQPLDDVGGDWYYHQVTPDGKVLGLIADITGHGLAAAFIGSMTKLAMTASNAYEPGELLKRMNELMAQQMPEGRFVTLIALLYDPSNGVVQVARGGHPPAILVKRAENKFDKIEPSGFAIGFFDDGDYQVQEAKLEPGDLIFIYTDGIPEAHNRAREIYGIDRMGEVLLKTPVEFSSKQALDAVLKDFNDFLDERKLKDDVTALIIKRK